MIKELKYVVYLLVFFFFIFFTVKYYFSDENKKNSYRSIQSIDKKNKKTYHFWKLLIDDKK